MASKRHEGARLFKGIQYEIPVVVLIAMIFTVRLVVTLSEVRDMYHFFVILFYIIGIALLLLITFRAYDLAIDQDTRELEAEDESDGLKTEDVVE